MQRNETPVDGAKKWLDDDDNQDILIFAGGVFAAALLGVYFGGGRHLKRLKNVEKDLVVVRNGFGDLFSYFELKETMKDNQMDRISYAIENGIKFKHFPGLGVMYPDGGIPKAMR